MPGSKGTDLPHSVELNHLPNQFLSLGTGLNQAVRNPFFGLVLTGPLAAATVPRQQLLLPYPQFRGISAGYAAPVGHSTYHSLHMRLNQRFGRAGLVNVSYTLSKHLTDTESRSSWLEDGGQSGNYYDEYNRRLDKSLANFDSTHRLVLNYNYELPFGRGRALLGSTSGLAGFLIAGGQINGITTLQSGVPVYMRSRPNLIADPTREGEASERLENWFNTAAFAAGPAFGFGNAPRTLPGTRSDGLVNFDFSLLKNTYVKERFNVQFRAEFFNVMNSVQFARPNTTFGNLQFGLVNQQANGPRQSQLALKFIS